MLKEFRQIRIKREVIGLLFLPLFLYSFFSVGTMPVFSKQGFEIVICASDTTQTIIIDENGEPVDEIAHTACDWSAHLHDTTISKTVSPYIEIQLAQLRLPILDDAPLKLRNTSNNRHARAPPLSV